MRTFTSSYRHRWPWQLSIAVGLAAVLSMPPLVFYATALFTNSAAALGNLGTQGDFFGGHVAAVTSSLTLVIVLATSYVQNKIDRTFRLREHFLAGLNVIGQYDIADSGCEQALRLVDHYSALALELEDKELLLLLNTVMTKGIRLRLEELESGRNNEIYVYARVAKKRIAEILKEHHMSRKGLMPK